MTFADNATSLQEQLNSYASKSQETQKFQSKLTNNESGILGFVKTQGTHLFIPANTSTTVRGTTRKVPENITVLVEQTESSLFPDLLIPPTLATVDSHGRILFEITNMSSQDVVKERPSRIAKISLCHQVVPELEPSLEEIKANKLDDFPFQINIGLKDISGKNNQELIELFRKFYNIFSRNDNDLGSTDVVNIVSRRPTIFQFDTPTEEFHQT